jgi:hypothetical protein
VQQYLVVIEQQREGNNIVKYDIYRHQKTPVQFMCFINCTGVFRNPKASDKGNNYNYFGKDTGKGINLTDVFISNDIDDILIAT